MSKQAIPNVINLSSDEEDSDESDLIAICNDFLNKRSDLPRPTPPAIKKQATDSGPFSANNNKNILNYFNVYRKNTDDSFELLSSKSQPSTSKASKEINDSDDFAFLDDDEDLMTAVPFYVPPKPSSSLHRVKSENVVSSNAITQVYNEFGANEYMSEADKKAISQALSDLEQAHIRKINEDNQMSEEDVKAVSDALNDLERTYNSNQIDSATLQTIELLDICDILDATELESYNENAATIRSLSIVHPDLEHLDPNPDIFELYRQFDQRFFEGFLTAKALKLGWANNFYTMAGAYYPFKEGVPTILLSANLLTLRPRKDLVETLIHEMIHAYIDLQRIKDNNDHGKVFQFHMKRINQSAGTSITIYHSFHDEVSYLRKYIWRCTGSKCQSVRPYRGFISLPTKRKPSRWDAAFRAHQQMGCTGTFVQMSNNFNENNSQKRTNNKKKN